MHLTQLSLTNFRNYARQTLELAPGRVLLLGENAQGKTNLLEAIFVLATGRSERASVDADYIAWDVRDEAQPFAQIAATALRASGEVTVELTIAGRPGTTGLVASKRFKLNGVAKRGADIVGTVLAVMFTTDDMDLVSGSPSGRRRYLDVMLSQAERRYARALSAYNKLVTQRNALLKRIREGNGKNGELAYWDEEMSREGATLLIARAGAMAQISQLAADAHQRLSGERDTLAVVYMPRADWTGERIAASSPEDVGEALLQRLRTTHSRDIGAGLTLTGPHRDDFTLTIGAQAAASFASRGQQRTAALALRLAEVGYLRDSTGEQPILLLDDVLSELDEQRRSSVLHATDYEQVIVTSPDPDRFSGEFIAGAQVWEIAGGHAHQRRD